MTALLQVTSAMGVPLQVAVVRLCKMFGEDLRLCEPVLFHDGAAAVDTVLRRARLSGQVTVGAEVQLQDHWADLLDRNGNLVSHAALDAASFGALKGHWMRCRYDDQGKDPQRD